MERQGILKGRVHFYDWIKMGIGEYFFEQAKKYPDQVLQIDAETGYQETYNDVKRRTTRVALYLKQLEIQPQEIILLCCINDINNVVAAFAPQLIGAVTASVDPKQSPEEIARALKLLEPKVIFVEENSVYLIEKSIELAKQNPIIITIGCKSIKYTDMLEIEKKGDGEEEFQLYKAKCSELAVILFSSGTTGTPKGISLSHFALINNSQLGLYHKVSREKVYMLLSTFNWIASWLWTILCISTGAAKLYARNYLGEKFLEIVDKYKVTLVASANTFTYSLTCLDPEIYKKYDLSSLQTFMIGGSTVAEKQMRNLKALFPRSDVTVSYGSTESGGAIALHELGNGKLSTEKIMSSGTVVFDVEVKFVDLEINQLSPPNHKSEIRVKTPYVMLGYFKQPVLDAFDSEGYLKVGDIGYYDEDGYIYVTGRLKESFKYLTTYISPSILESVLYTHPAISAAVVVGIPNEIDRHHPAACVVLKKGQKVTEEEICEYVKGKVSDAYRLRGGVKFVERIPTTYTGKHDRRSIRDNFSKM